MAERRGLGRFRASSLLSVQREDEHEDAGPSQRESSAESATERPAHPAPATPVSRQETPVSAPEPPAPEPAPSGVPESGWAGPSETQSASPSPATQDTARTPAIPATTESRATPVSVVLPASQPAHEADTLQPSAESDPTVRDTVYLKRSLERRLANAVYWARLTKNAIYIEGVERVLADLEAKNGGPFPDIPADTILKHAKAARRRSQ